MLNVIMLIFILNFADFHSAECRDADWHYAVCHCTECHQANIHFSECDSANRPLAECHYTEWHFANTLTMDQIVFREHLCDVRPGTNVT